jgi:WD40 repeat protein
VDGSGEAAYCGIAEVAAFASLEEGAMSIRATLVVGICGLGLVAGLSGRGEPMARTDRYGDPLPPCVVARPGTERLTLTQMASEVKFSPDGRRLAAYDTTEQLRIWDVNSGKELLRLKALPFRGSGDLAFAPDGKTLAMGCGDQTLRVWEVATGKELHRFPIPTGQVMHLVFSPDGRSLFAASLRSPVVCWDLGSGKLRKIGDAPAGYVALSQDGKTLTVGSADERDWRKGTFTRWDIASGKEIGRHTLALTLSGNWSSYLAPDGRLFARPEEDGKSITLLDPLTGKEISRAQGCDYPANIVFSADGSLMTCRSKQGMVHVWDTASGKVRTRFKASSFDIDRIALSPDGKRLALTGRADNAVHVWDVTPGREVHSFTGHRGGPLTVAFCKDGKEIATVSRDGSLVGPIVTWADWSLRRWDAASGTERAVIQANLQGEALYAVFSADGQRLAMILHNGTLRLWDVQSGKELRSWKVPTRETTEIRKDEKGGQTTYTFFRLLIGAPAFSPDGKILFAAVGSTIHRWETATGRELPSFEVAGMKREDYTGCLASPDGRTLLVWSGSTCRPLIVLLDSASGKAQRRLQGIELWGHGPAFSPDGRTFAIGEIDAVTLWEVASGRSRGRLKGPRWTFSLAFSPDGRLLAAGTDPDAPLSLWDMTTGQVAGQLRNDLGRVDSLAFSPDGSRLAVAGHSTAALLCDVAALCGTKKGEQTVKTEELEDLWAALSSTDGARAYRAIGRLGLTGSRGAAFLKKRLRDDKPPDERRMVHLIADLDNDNFATREKAFTELEKLGIRAEPALRRALEGAVSAEVRSRIKRLLERLGTPPGAPPSAELIRLRVVEALEANGSDAAHQVLAELSKDTKEADLTREAKASLDRLSRRLTSKP